MSDDTTSRVRADGALADRSSITDAPGAHPVGTGVGAIAGGLAAGAAVGTVAGPLGTMVGAVVGAVAGGLAGSGIAEMIDPAAEEEYWRDNYGNRPYVASGAAFDDYGPAYRYGVDSYGKWEGGDFEELEPKLRDDWESARGNSRLEWHDARHATRDSWERLGTRTARSDAANAVI